MEQGINYKNTIIQHISPIFTEWSEILAYANSFSQGTHLFIFNLKDGIIDREVNGQPDLVIGEEYLSKKVEKDERAIKCLNGLIDCSLRSYIRYMYLENMEQTPQITDEIPNSIISPQILIKGVNISSKNPYQQLSKYLLDLSNTHDVRTQTISHTINLRSDIYKLSGFIFHGIGLSGNINTNSFSSFCTQNDISNIGILFNGILIYYKEKLIGRLKITLGDLSTIIRKVLNKKRFSSQMEENSLVKDIFDWHGWILLEGAEVTLGPTKHVYIYIYI